MRRKKVAVTQYGAARAGQTRSARGLGRSGVPDRQPCARGLASSTVAAATSRASAYSGIAGVFNLGEITLN